MVLKNRIEGSTAPVAAWFDGLSKNRIVNDNPSNMGASPFLSYDF